MYTSVGKPNEEKYRLMYPRFTDTKMAGKAAASSLPSDGEDERSCRLVPWQKAWLAHYREELVRRVPTMAVVDRLIQRRAMDTGTDVLVYQNIRACHEEKRNERARLLLDFIATQTQKTFWYFQTALMLESCSDLAVRQEDEKAVAESFAVLDLSEPACSDSSVKRKQRPASVELVIEKLKKRYRKRRIAVFIPRAQPHAQSLFLFPIVFGINNNNEVNLALRFKSSFKNDFELFSMISVARCFKL